MLDSRPRQRGSYLRSALTAVMMMAMAGAAAQFPAIRLANADTGQWAMQQKLRAVDGASTDVFGWSVSISGGVVLVGAYLCQLSTQTPDVGAAYLFQRSGNTWTQTGRSEETGLEPHDVYGYSVSISGLSTIVGAPMSTAPMERSGASYVWVPATLATVSDWEAME